MNPSAKAWVPNVGASAWTPSNITKSAIVQDVSDPKYTANVQSSPSETLCPALPKENVAMVNEEGKDDEEMDENDPLWIATLKLTGGDRAKAVSMLEDPDSLMIYPEIKSIMENSLVNETETDNDWEKSPVIISSSKVSTNETKDEKIINPALNQNEISSSIQSDGIPSTFGEMVISAEDEEAIEQAVSTPILAEGDPREHLNIVFIGHVDAGKSTLSGSILYLMGKVDKRTIERFEREAKERNRESWFLAFILDTSEEERAKGKTVEVGRAHFETVTNRYTILDAPGHKNYVPNMISGATQADVGVLVISARKGEFETGFEKGGQTREHALLAKTLGVEHLVVVINKMDDPTVNWSLDRYEECVGKLKPYLKQVGYIIKKDVKFVPISALSGDNVLNEVSGDTCKWWKKMYTTGGHNTTTPTLLATLDSLTISNRNPDDPLRIPCLDRYFETGCIVLGKVESGTLRLDDEIVIAPTKKRAKVKEITIGEDKVRSAKPGENVLMKFNINVEDIQKGYVLCLPNNICPAVTEIRVRLALVDMLEHRPIFSPGYDAVMHVHTVEIEVNCLELISVTDPKTKKEMKRPYARQGQMCVAKLAMPLHTCMETFERMPSMGRLTIRDEGKTIAIGKILEVISK